MVQKWKICFKFDFMLTLVRINLGIGFKETKIGMPKITTMITSNVTTYETILNSRCTSTFSSHVKVNTHMKNVHFIFDMGADHHLDDDDEDNVGYQCRHCEDARYTELLDMEQHLVEVHDIKTDLSMHYLNK